MSNSDSRPNINNGTSQISYDYFDDDFYKKLFIVLCCFAVFFLILFGVVCIFISIKTTQLLRLNFEIRGNRCLRRRRRNAEQVQVSAATTYHTMSDLTPEIDRGAHSLAISLAGPNLNQINVPNSRFSACLSNLNDCIDQNCSFKLNQANERDIRDHLNRHLLFKNYQFKCKICDFGLLDDSMSDALLKIKNVAIKNY
jgi:hypothetical protein